MLVLTRRKGETIMIGDEITIKVLEIKGRTVRIGLEAPRDVKIIRGELDGTRDSDHQRDRTVAS